MVILYQVGSDKLFMCAVVAMPEKYMHVRELQYLIFIPDTIEFPFEWRLFLAPPVQITVYLHCSKCLCQLNLQLRYSVLIVSPWI